MSEQFSRFDFSRLQLTVSNAINLSSRTVFGISGRMYALYAQKSRRFSIGRLVFQATSSLSNMLIAIRTFVHYLHQTYDDTHYSQVQNNKENGYVKFYQDRQLTRYCPIKRPAL